MLTQNALPVLRRAALSGLLLCAAAALLLTGGCGNNPYPPGESEGKVTYSLIGDDPKSLDPSFSYTVSEGAIVDLIYPAFYRYHFLKADPVALGAEHRRGRAEARSLPLYANRQRR